MKVIILALCCFMAFLNNANAGAMYNCIDRDGNIIITDNPQDGMKNCVSSNLPDTISSWPIKSAEKMRKSKKMVTEHVTKLAEKDNYFNSSFINTYATGLMNSINQNNGQGAIIAHDANRWCNFTFTLDNDENIKQIKVDRYQKDFGKTFKEYKIDQSKWSDLIRQFNTLGYAVTTTVDGSLKYYRDFDKDSFYVTVTHQTAGYGNEIKHKSSIDNRDEECREKLKALIEPLKDIINKADLSMQECRRGNTKEALEYAEQILVSSRKLTEETSEASSNCKDTSMGKALTEAANKLTNLQTKAQNSIRLIHEIGCHYRGPDGAY